MSINSSSSHVSHSKPKIDYTSLIAGTAGGAASTAVFHPLELIKIRWQVYENISFKQVLLKKDIQDGFKNASAPKYRPKYRSLFNTLSSVYNSENGIRGLYRGFGINTLGMHK